MFREEITAPSEGERKKGEEGADDLGRVRVEMMIRGVRVKMMRERGREGYRV